MHAPYITGPPPSTMYSKGGIDFACCLHRPCGVSRAIQDPVDHRTPPEPANHPPGTAYSHIPFSQSRSPRPSRPRSRRPTRRTRSGASGRRPRDRAAAPHAALRSLRPRGVGTAPLSDRLSTVRRELCDGQGVPSSRRTPGPSAPAGRVRVLQPLLGLRFYKKGQNLRHNETNSKHPEIRKFFLGVD